MKLTELFLRGHEIRREGESPVGATRDPISWLGPGGRVPLHRPADRAQYALTGFVRNLRDGRVQLVVEGMPEELNRCLGHLARTMENYIESTDVRTSPATGEFTGFDIRY